MGTEVGIVRDGSIPVGVIDMEVMAIDTSHDERIGMMLDGTGISLEMGDWMMGDWVVIFTVESQRKVTGRSSSREEAA